MKIFWQNEILDKIDSYTLSSLPKAICLFGLEGSGKKTIAQHLADKLGVPMEILKEDVDQEALADCQKSTIDKLYVILLDGMSEKNQSKFLKFIEEPYQHVHIVLTAQTEVGILDTILNRCIKLKLKDYSKEQLKEFRQNCDERLYSICKTPGQIFSVDDSNFQQLISLCETIVSKINAAPYANAMSIAQKINYKDEYDKFDFGLFLNTLEYVAFEEFKKTKSELSLIVYNIVNEYKSRLFTINNSPIKENYMMNMLTEIWEKAR